MDLTESPAVVCLGEVLLDLIAEGGDGTIAGAATFRRAAGGAPANVAVGLARLGVPAAFVGKVSADAFGRSLREVLEDEGVDLGGLVVDPRARTPLAFVGRERGGGRSFVFYHRGMADAILRPDEVDPDLVRSARIFHFGSVSLAAEPGRAATLAAARLARESDRLVSMDPNLRLGVWDGADEARRQILDALRLVDLVKVSEEEASFLTEQLDLAAAAAELRRVGPSLAVVTLAERGAYFQTATAEGHVPPFHVAALETTGAGDAFMAGILSRFLTDDRLGARPWPAGAIEDAVRWANAAGAIATTRSGAIPSLPTLAAVEAVLHGQARGGAVPGLPRAT